MFIVEPRNRCDVGMLLDAKPVELHLKIKFTKITLILKALYDTAFEKFLSRSPYSEKIAGVHSFSRPCFLGTGTTQKLKNYMAHVPLSRQTLWIGILP